ncbi:MAG: adenosylmethionine--8-amino-7-oxononanoate transaminase, partial [Nitrososphaeraceae archaeon]
MNKWDISATKIITKGRGFYLIDSEGRKYLDGIASMWCNVWGHGEKEIVMEMKKQINLLQHSSLFSLANKPSIELSVELLRLSKGMEQIFYSDNGSTAVEVAMKMAIQYYNNKGRPEKRHFVSLQNGYHGDTIGAMSVGYVPRYFSAYRPLLTRVTRFPTPSLKLGEPVSELDEILEKTESRLKKVSAKTCAIVMESGAQIAGGIKIYPQGYQKGIADLCSKYGVLLILDEIATGFGRLGNMVEYLKQGSIPDIVCFGKALTAGYTPLAVTLTNSEIFRSFLDRGAKLYHGHTFCGHPIGCATAIANLKLYRKRGLMRDISLKSRYIRKRLHEFQNSAAVINVRHEGMLAGLDISKRGVDAIRKKTGEPVDSFIFKHALNSGVYLRPLGKTIVVIPPLAIDRQNLEYIL